MRYFMKGLFRCIGLMLLMFPISYCIHQNCSNLYLRLGLIICFALGLVFVQFRTDEW